MLALISPAKKLTFDTRDPSQKSTDPIFLKDTLELSKVTSKLSRADLRQMMKISDKLADLNYQRFQNFKENPIEGETKQAILAFAGDTYTGLDAPTLVSNDLKFAQDHLRILSGFYGLLRPLDMIQPYRLEMGRKLRTKRGETLYEFWGDKLANAIDEQLKGHKKATVINLASNEYFKAISGKTLKAPIINMIFKEEKAGQYKVIGLFAKRARGAMARYMIKNRIETPEDLKSFVKDGYTYQPSMSNDRDWVFTRP